MGETRCNKRNYGVDLLRLVTMFFAIILHLLGQGGVIGNLEALSIKYEIAWLIETACYCAVNCFALISGYVGILGGYKYSNIVVLWIQVVSYTILITLGCTFFIEEIEFNRTLCMNMLFPVFTEQYWYFTAYVGLFIMMPIYNKMLEVISRKQIKNILMTTLIMFSLVPTIIGRDVFILNNGYSFLWLSILYVIGGYISKYALIEKISIKKGLFIYLVCVFVSWGEKYCYEFNNYKVTGEIVFREKLINYTSPTILLSAIVLLCVFAKIKINEEYKKIIATLSACSFGIYLIHVHPLIFSRISGRFSFVSGMPIYKMLLSILIIGVCIFILCLGVELIRNIIFKRLRVKELLLQIEERILND